MKNLLFVTSFGLAVFFTNAAFGQEAVAGDTTKQEKKYNPKSNSKHNPDREFGKDRAATVQEMNGKTEKIADKKEGKTADEKAEKAADKAAKKNEKSVSNEQKKQQKDARKAEKERLKAEKKMVKKNKIK